MDVLETFTLASIISFNQNSLTVKVNDDMAVEGPLWQLTLADISANLV